MKINKLLSALFIFSVLLFNSCSNDDDGSDNLPKGAYENGILISGEGSGAGTGSVSFVSEDLSFSENLIFKKNNNDLELGTFLQSIAFNDSKAFIVVDNTNTITVVDRYTFEYEGEIIEGLSAPRFMTIVGNKGYVTNWGSTSDDTDDFVAVVDLSTYAVEGTISVGNGPERIIAKGGKLFVSHKGAYTTNNIVSVIDIATENLQEITVKDNPDELEFNSAGNLVVLSEGRTIYDADWNVIGNTEGSISTINTSSLEVDSEIVFAEGEHPSLMVVNNGDIYYASNGKVYTIDENAGSLSTTSIVESQGYLYGLEVENDNIYLLDANFSDLSELHVYDLGTQAKIETVSVALGASKIYFN
ncbi:cell surface protein [Tamlana sp. s12]|uniref:YncE family protein n=1 Tax=Tamlana sp. s12 TaxID=1630406 RepID=UPI0008007399|nr:cell surface protein [Tamlana sp. s12]OBQ55431.1 cell surface protein [Tamlana sp. s12]QQY83913.1 cell surface protein [Tamlana sp. s12]